ncbi:uncharacterized protein LOC110038625 [Phalaenopsis equestris]|uniref:uncharacterized protein LOC110038625 n=1 Tax=Phalaenopsis equestris TaxID=78828 RepID=UPI0009E5BE14|nr:uncharacterized protein LOC110038625 [Phalaenopsis equestris]
MDYFSRSLNQLFSSTPHLAYQHKSNVCISHLAYADDVIIFFKATKNATKMLYKALKHFSAHLSWRLWLFLLPTDDILKMKGLRGPSVCLLCLVEEETLDHLFFYCNFSKKVLNELLPKFKNDTMNLSWFNFFNCWEEWNQINLQVLPCIVAWFIWMCRNSVNYEGSTPLVKAVTTHCTSYQQKIIKYHRFTNIFRNWVPQVDIQCNFSFSLIEWAPPPTGWLKANTDGSFLKGSAGCGGVFRNSLGHHVLHFSSPTWALDAVETEMIAIYWALKIAVQCNMGIFNH